jgi:hypothetical protein
MAERGGSSLEAVPLEALPDQLPAKLLIQAWLRGEQRFGLNQEELTRLYGDLPGHFKIDRSIG